MVERREHSTGAGGGKWRLVPQQREVERAGLRGWVGAKLLSQDAAPLCELAEHLYAMQNGLPRGSAVRETIENSLAQLVALLKERLQAEVRRFKEGDQVDTSLCEARGQGTSVRQVHGIYCSTAALTYRARVSV